MHTPLGREKQKLPSWKYGRSGCSLSWSMGGRWERNGIFLLFFPLDSLDFVGMIPNQLTSTVFRQTLKEVPSRLQNPNPIHRDHFTEGFFFCMAVVLLSFPSPFYPGFFVGHLGQFIYKIQQLLSWGLEYTFRNPRYCRKDIWHNSDSLS